MKESRSNPRIIPPSPDLSLQLNKREIIHLFGDILMVCKNMELLGGTHFSPDGLRLPSNVSKEWSGTFAKRHPGGKWCAMLKNAFSWNWGLDIGSEKSKNQGAQFYLSAKGLISALAYPQSKPNESVSKFPIAQPWPQPLSTAYWLPCGNTGFSGR